MKLNRFCASSALVCATGMAFSGISVSAEIEEIVVTGLKKTSSVMETPSAITALTGDDLIARGITELTDLQFAVPSFHYGQMLPQLPPHIKKNLQLKCSKGERFLRKKRGEGGKSMWTKTQKTEILSCVFEVPPSLVSGLGSLWSWRQVP